MVRLVAEQVYLPCCHRETRDVLRAGVVHVGQSTTSSYSVLSTILQYFSRNSRASVGFDTVIDSSSGEVYLSLGRLCCQACLFIVCRRHLPHS
jgi:hypothetical protein